MAATPSADDRAVGGGATCGCLGGGDGPRADAPASQRLHRALRFLSAPLRRTQAAAGRHLAPRALAATQLAALKARLRLRLRRGTPTHGDAAEAQPQREVLLNADAGVASRQRSRFRGNAVSTAKYNLLTFLPRFFFEMFSRLAYTYFLIQTALAWWPAVSPYDPWGATVALAFVLFVSGVKAVWEDSKRHRADWATNARTTRIMCGDGAFRRVPWRSVRVGDVVMTGDEEEVPADLLCIYAALPDRVCYVQTTNLDGETNLKIRSPVLLANTPAAHLAPLRPSEVTRLRARVLCESPNANLHHFHGRMDVLAPPAPLHQELPVEDGGARLDAALASAGSVLASIPLSMDDMLLRGCKLKNSDFILGVALYTGSDTRIMRNSRRAPFKAGAFDRYLNAQIALLMSLQVLICTGMAIGSVLWRRAHQSHWYFEWQARTGNNSAHDAVYGLLNWLTFWVLFSYLVPISLFVSMEIVKFMQGALFVNLDEAMRDPATGERALARNTNLNEDLGMVEYVFCDKTGTLTSNEMRLRLLVLVGDVYGDPGFELERCTLPPHRALRAFDARLADALLSEADEGGASSSSTAEGMTRLQRAAVEALVALAVCHTLIVEEPHPPSEDATPLAQLPPPDDCAPVYQGPSPDEVALVDGARRLGVRFASRGAAGVGVSFLGAPLAFEVLNELSFSSERQRMSVIVRRPDGRVTLLCKGADAAVLPLLAPPASPADADVRARTEEHLHRLAVLGLRTLVLAARDFTEEEWAAWDAKYQAAVVSLDATREAAVAAEAERALTLLGATGVEDKLQAGVPDAIRTLLAARMRVWVITGDKQETAITVGVACGLLRDPDTALLLNAATLAATRSRMAELQALALARAHAGLNGGDGARGPELVVDGRTLTHVLSDRVLSQAFAALGAGARAVVVCRAAPRQKAAVVKLMQRYLRADETARELAALPDAQLVTPQRWWCRVPRWLAAVRRVYARPSGRTLAIGDGANDVAMLQAADVGVGIAGREGRQAANTADFALNQFRFLTRLLLVHGTLSQHRLSRLIKYSFYKNIAFSGLLFFFQFYCGYSGQALYDSISAGLYNVVLTSLPVLVYALLDRPATDAELLAHPQLYNSSSSLTGRAFWKTLVDAHVHSAICFFFALYAVPSTGGPKSIAGLLAIGKTAYTAILLAVSIEILLVARYVTALFVFITLLSVAVWWPLLYLIPAVANVNEFIAIAPLIDSSPVFWLTIALTSAATFAYRFAWVAYNRLFRPNDFDLLAQEAAAQKARRDADTPRPLRILPGTGLRRRRGWRCFGRGGLARARGDALELSHVPSEDELAAAAAADGV